MGENREYKMAIKIAGEVEKSFYNSTKLTKKELREIARNASTTSATLSQTFSRGLSDAAPAFNGIEKASAAAFHAVTTAAAAAAAAVGGITAASVAVGASFEEQMSTVRAISGASGAEMKELNEMAKELGATTQFTATEAGQAMEYMAMAGWKTQDMLNGMPGVLNLAAASGEDLAATSDIVTDAMTAFGLSADEVGHFSDVLAATATNSNTTVGMMGETFTYAASLAGAMGYNIEDTSIAIGLMANSGIKASQAGTALRKIFTETVGGAKVSAKAFGEMTIATTKQDGSMRDLKDVMTDLRGAFSAMTDSEKALNAENIAGKTGMSGLLAIVNASEADFTKLSDAVYDCAGAAEAMADIRLDNLSGDVTIAKSAMEGLGIQIYEDLSEPLRYAVQAGTALIGQFSARLGDKNFISDITEKIPTAIRETKQFGSALVDFTEPFFKIAKWLLNNPGVIVGTIAAVGTALATYKIANGVMSIVTALGALGPVGGGILALGAIVGVITGIGFAVKKAANEAKKANLDAHFGKISLSLSELNKIAEDIIETDNLGQVRNAIAAFENLDGVQDSINESLAAINKTNWKVSIGMELSKTEMEEYQSNLGSYVQQCQQYVTDKQYAINLAVGVLTDDDLKGQNIVQQVNDFYTGKQNELADLGTKLNEAITDAFQDGLLDMDEAKRISEIQAEMAEIQAALAGTNFDAEMETLSIKYGGALDADSFQNLQAELAEKAESAKGDYEEAFTSAAASALTMLKDDAINQSQYDDMIGEYKKNYLDQIAGIEASAAEFQVKTITQQYKSEISEADPALKEAIEKQINEMMSSDQIWNTNTSADDWRSAMQRVFDESLAGIELNATTKDAMGELYNQLLPTKEQLEGVVKQCEEAGKEIPEAIMTSLSNINQIGALSGNADALWTEIGNSLGNSKEYATVLELAETQGVSLPEALKEGMLKKQPEAAEQAEKILKDIKVQFEEGIEVTVPVTYEVVSDYYNRFVARPETIKLKDVMQESQDISTGVPQGIMDALPGYATGGLIEKPTVAWFAEESPEMAIPIDGSRNAINLWHLAGQLLGMDTGKQIESDGLSSLASEINHNSITNESSTPVNFSPQINFYGNAPEKSDMEDVLDSSLDKFKALYREMQRQEGRLAF